ncbi:MAG: hypothetical protein HOP11_08600 [Saprospiraceae bacterium]|nr:hypothetical protein [Saprospiraceae bacterium]
MMNVSKITLIVFIVGVLSQTCCQTEPSKSSTSSNLHQLIEKRKNQIQNALQQNSPVIQLIQDPKAIEFKAQEIALSDPKLKALFTEQATGKKMLNEVFSVSQSRPSDYTLRQKNCTSSNCYRVEIYNYALNSMVISIVDVQKNIIISSEYYSEMQPDIPPHLAELALAIAIEDTSVIRAYNGKLDPAHSRMQATKTALNRSKCQRSQHLCVAPTFVKGNKALWSIVDLTELKVAGVKWTEVGTTGIALTERVYQNEKIMSCYCEVENSIEKDGWSFNYSLTRSDGLKISNVKRNNVPYFTSVKLMDWHVSYSKTEGFGYSDAIGCPEYSNAAVVAIEAPEIKLLIKDGDTLGFELYQQYFSEGWPTPCSYNYAQHFEFYKDGSFRPIVASLGRGCGNDGTYRPVTRIAFAGNEQEILEFEKKQWNKWTQEKWKLQTDADQYENGKYIFKLQNTGGANFLIEANRGQFGDGGRGDNAYYYITKLHKEQDEGELDLPTLGPCCNTDYKQGPEKFMEDENLDQSQLVLWYVPQIKNDNTPGKEYCWAESILENGVYVSKTWPCPSGPKLTPFQ